MVTRLQESLQLIIPDLGFTMSQPADLRAIFWAVCVGGVAAMRRYEQEWYVVQAASFFGPLKLRIEMDMERTLENILWHDCWDLPLHEFWVAAFHLRLN